LVEDWVTGGLMVDKLMREVGRS